MTFFSVFDDRKQTEQGPKDLLEPTLPEIIAWPRAAADHPWQPLPPRSALWVHHYFTLWIYLKDLPEHSVVLRTALSWLFRASTQTYATVCKKLQRIVLDQCFWSVWFTCIFGGTTDIMLSFCCLSSTSKSELPEDWFYSPCCQPSKMLKEERNIQNQFSNNLSK